MSNDGTNPQPHSPSHQSGVVETLDPFCLGSELVIIDLGSARTPSVPLDDPEGRWHSKDMIGGAFQYAPLDAVFFAREHPFKNKQGDLRHYPILKAEQSGHMWAFGCILYLWAYAKIAGGSPY